MGAVNRMPQQQQQQALPAYLEIREGERYCTLCNQWATDEHLGSKRHLNKKWWWDCQEQNSGAASSAAEPSQMSSSGMYPNPLELPPGYGNPAFYKWNSEQGKYYCLLCGSFAEEAHVSSVRHKQRAETPQYYLNVDGMQALYPPAAVSQLALPAPFYADQSPPGPPALPFRTQACSAPSMQAPAPGIATAPPMQAQPYANPSPQSTPWDTVPQVPYTPAPVPADNNNARNLQEEASLPPGWFAEWEPRSGKFYYFYAVNGGNGATSEPTWTRPIQPAPPPMAPTQPPPPAEAPTSRYRSVVDF